MHPLIKLAFDDIDAGEPSARIIHNAILGGWFVVKGSRHVPISGRLESLEEGLAWLKRRAEASAHKGSLGPKARARSRR